MKKGTISIHKGAKNGIFLLFLLVLKFIFNWKLFIRIKIDTSQLQFISFYSQYLNKSFKLFFVFSKYFRR
jgi:hypothetical protein